MSKQPSTGTAGCTAFCTAFLLITPSKARADIIKGTNVSYYLLEIPHTTAGGKKTKKEIAYRSCLKQVGKNQVYCVGHQKQAKLKGVVTWKDLSGKADCLNPAKVDKPVTDPHLFSIHQPLQFKMTEEQQSIFQTIFSEKQNVEEKEEPSSSSKEDQEEDLQMK